MCNRDKKDEWNLTVSAKNGVIKGLQPCFSEFSPQQRYAIQTSSELQLYSLLPANTHQGLKLDIAGDWRRKLSLAVMVLNVKSSHWSTAYKKHTNALGLFQGAVYLSRAFSQPQFKGESNVCG